MNSLLTCPWRFALMTLAMVFALGQLLPPQAPAEQTAHTVVAVKPAR